MIEIDSIENLVKASPDYKVILHRGVLHVVAVESIEKGYIDWDMPEPFKYASVLSVTEHGQLIKSRYTESGTRTGND